MPTSRELPEESRAEELHYSPQDHLLALIEALVCCVRYFCGKHPEFSVTELFSWGKARRGARTCSKPQGSAWLHGSPLFALSMSVLSPGSYLVHRGEVHSGARPLEWGDSQHLPFCFGPTLWTPVSLSLPPEQSALGEEVNRDEMKGLDSFK